MTPTLSVCMIMKNEAHFLPHTLPSLATADELIIVDTGSTDNSVEIASTYTPHVAFFDWVNDYAAAKNAALNLATKEWILVMDADEFISESQIQQLKIHLADTATMLELPIYDVAQFDTTPSGSVYSRPKVFPNRQGIAYVGAINESLQRHWPPIFSKPISDSQIYICHWGGSVGLSESAMAQKRNRYIAQYEAILAQNPAQAAQQYFLGIHYWNAEMRKEAKECWEKTLDYSQELELTVVASVRLAVFYQEIDPDKGRLILQECLEKTTKYPEPYNQMGLSCLRRFQLEDARRHFEHALNLPYIHRVYGTDSREYDYWPQWGLAVIDTAQGHPERAVTLLEGVVSRYPEEVVMKRELQKAQGALRDKERRRS